MTEKLSTITNNLVTLSAIVGVTFLGYHDVTDAMVIGAIAGLGGYKLLKDRQQSE